MRAFLRERGLVGQDVALCRECHQRLCEQVLGNYRAMERFEEGARFLEEFGRVEEAFAMLAGIKG